MRWLYLFLMLASAGMAQFRVESTLGNCSKYAPADTFSYHGKNYRVFNNTKGIFLSEKAGKDTLRLFPILDSTASRAFKPGGRFSIALDRSDGIYHGRIYVCWDDARNGKENEDIYLCFSDDLGRSWTEPLLLSWYPNHRRQFSPVIKTDGSGNVFVTYFSGQDHHEKNKFDVYAGISYNGGLRFNYYRLNERSFYAAHSLRVDLNPKIEVSWKENNKGKCMRRKTVINDTCIFEYESQLRKSPLHFEKTVIYTENIKLTLTIDEDLILSAGITKPLEPGFEKTVFEQLTFKKGDHEIEIKSKDLGLKKGSYVLTLYYPGKSSYCWIISE